MNLWRDAREETMSLAEEAGGAEAEIDERVKSLYGI